MTVRQFLRVLFAHMIDNREEWFAALPTDSLQRLEFRLACATSGDPDRVPVVGLHELPEGAVVLVLWGSREDANRMGTRTSSGRGWVLMATALPDQPVANLLIEVRSAFHIGDPEESAVMAPLADLLENIQLIRSHGFAMNV